MFKYDPNSGFYTDNCFSYTTENGTDIILNDRKQEFTDNKLSLCENQCNYTGYDKDNKQSSCDCNVKNKMDLINEIFNAQNESSYVFNPDESTSSSSNMVTIKCTKALFSKDGLKNNISSYILIIFITQFIISILLFIKCGYRLLEEDIRIILEAKNKKEKSNIHNNNNNNNGGKKKQKEKRKNIRTNNYPPKKRSIKLINNFNNNKMIKQSKTNFNFLPRGNSKKNNIKKKNKAIKCNKVNSIAQNKNNKFTKSSSKLSKKITISYNDSELNLLNYNNALLYDKRTCCQYYLSLIKSKNIILFSFCPAKDYNSRIIKLCIFSLSFSIHYAINYSFFTEKTIHAIYETGGKYDILYFMPKISISSAISYLFTSLIKFIFLSERNILKIKMQPKYSLASDISTKEKKNLCIKYSIFFILGLLFLFFFWLLLSSFGAVYQNTQMFIFKNALVSFSISFCFPFFISIFPAIFRTISIKSKTKGNECMFKFSKFLQVL